MHIVRCGRRSPKTKGSKRAVTLPTAAYVELKKHLERLERNQGLIFTTSTGGPISPRNFIRHFKQALKSAGLPDIKGARPKAFTRIFASGIRRKS